MRSLALLWRLAFRNLWRNSRRSILTCFAIALGVWSCATLSSIARGLSFGMAEDAIRNLTGHIQIQTEQYADDPSIEYAFLRATLKDDVLDRPEIASHTSRIRVPAVVMSERESYASTLVGIDPPSEQRQSFLPGAIVEGAYFTATDDDGVIVGRKLLDQLQTSLGKRVVIMSQGLDGKLAERGFRVVGVFKGELESTELSYIFTPLLRAQEMLGAKGGVTEVSILAKGRNYTDSLRAKLAKALPSVRVMTWEELAPFIASLIKLQGKFIGFLFVLVFSAVAFGIVNTLLMSVFERTYEIGLLQAIGMKPSQIVMQVIFESLVLVFIGMIVGNVAAFLNFNVLSHTGVDISVFAKGAQYLGANTIIYPIFVPEDWMKLNWVVMMVGVVSSVYPAFKASKMIPMEAMRSV